MQGKNNGVPVQPDLPQGYEMAYHEEREQKWTLYHKLDWAKHRQKAEVVRFCETLGEGRTVAFEDFHYREYEKAQQVAKLSCAQPAPA